MTYEIGALDIPGYRDEPVPNTVFRQHGDAAHLGIVLPGVEYTCDMPLLYYAVLVLLDAGADVLQVEYAYSRRPEYRQSPDAEREAWLYADATAACNVALHQRTYRRVTFIGKSIGTRAMGHLLTTNMRLYGVSAVWLTPLLRNERLRAQIGQAAPPSLFVIGTGDPHYDPGLLAEVCARTDGDALAVDGADHSLEIAGDVTASLDALTRTIRAVEWFLREPERGTA